MSHDAWKIDAKCRLCGSSMERVAIKNPYIDDHDDQCSNTECSDHGSAVKRLERRGRAAARAEEAYDNDQADRADEENDHDYSEKDD